MASIISSLSIDSCKYGLKMNSNFIFEHIHSLPIAIQVHGEKKWLNATLFISCSFGYTLQCTQAQHFPPQSIITYTDPRKVPLKSSCRFEKRHPGHCEPQYSTDRFFWCSQNVYKSGDYHILELQHSVQRLQLFHTAPTRQQPLQPHHGA